MEELHMEIKSVTDVQDLIAIKIMNLYSFKCLYVKLK